MILPCPARLLAAVTVAGVVLGGCGSTASERPLGTGTPTSDVAPPDERSASPAEPLAAPSADATSGDDRAPGDARTPPVDEFGTPRLFLTADDDGTTYRLTPDAQVELHLDASQSWSVDVDGSSVTLVETSSVGGGSDQVWEVRIQRAGTSVLRARSDDASVTITLDVEG